MKTRICPICRTASVSAPYAPFCSKRCADIDLQRWFAGTYAVPAMEQDDPEDAPGRNPDAVSR